MLTTNDIFLIKLEINSEGNLFKTVSRGAFQFTTFIERVINIEKALLNHLIFYLVFKAYSLESMFCDL